MPREPGTCCGMDGGRGGGGEEERGEGGGDLFRDTERGFPQKNSDGSPSPGCCGSGENFPRTEEGEKLLQTEIKKTPIRLRGKILPVVPQMSS